MTDIKGVCAPLDSQLVHEQRGLDGLNAPRGKKEPKGLGDTPNKIAIQGETEVGGDYSPQIMLSMAKATHDGAIDRAVVTLGEFNLSPDNMLKIAQVMQELTLLARDSVRLDRRAAREADVSAQMDAAHKIRDQATFNLSATIVTSSLAVMGSIASTAGAVKAVKLRTDARVEGNSATDLAFKRRDYAQSLSKDAINQRASKPNHISTEADRLDNRAAQQNLKAQRLENAAQSTIHRAEEAAKKIDVYSQAVGTATTELGKIIGAGLQQSAAERDAERVESQAQSTIARNLADDQSDYFRSYTDMLRGMLEKLSAIQQSQADTARYISRA